MLEKILPGAGIWRFFGFWRRVWARAQAARLGLIAGGAAFSAALALFPALGAVIALTSLMVDPAVVLQELQLLRPLLPGEIFALLEARLRALLAADNGALSFATLLSFCLMLWSARAGVSALLLGLDAIRGAPPRGGLVHAALSLLLTLVLLLVAVIALAAAVLLPLLLDALAAFWPDFPDQRQMLLPLGWAVALAVMLAGLGLLYRTGGAAQTPPWITPGALLVLLLWFAATYGLSLYLRAFPRFHEVYGSIGAAMALQIWLYLSAYLILLGAAVNAEWGRGGRV